MLSNPAARRAVARALSLGVLTTVLIACSSGGHPKSGTTTVPTAATNAPAGTVLQDALGLQDAFVGVVARVRPDVVEISTDSGLGSGVVYDGQGDIVTNNHVVADGSGLKVTLGDGRTMPATLVGTYPPDDLAVVKVSGVNLPAAATFADSSSVAVGAIALAIGNPLGLSSSVTEGVVSFNGRTVDEGNGVVLPDTIQTSAAINPGNSGGALADINGAVIGIPTLAATDPQLGGGAAPGIGFAIPSNTVQRIADQLIRTGKVTQSGRAALGVVASDVVTTTGQAVGVLVRGTQPGSAAAKAGISPGDIIIGIGGKPTPDLGTLGDVLAGLQPGDHVAVDVITADGQHKTYQVTLGNL